MMPLQSVIDRDDAVFLNPLIADGDIPDSCCTARPLLICPAADSDHWGRHICMVMLIS